MRRTMTEHPTPSKADVADETRDLLSELPLLTLTEAAKLFPRRRQGKRRKRRSRIYGGPERSPEGHPFHIWVAVIVGTAHA